jgi:plastocyanin
MARSLVAALAALSLLALALAPAASAPTYATTLHISALASGLRYSTAHLTAKAGAVTIVMKNNSPIAHDVAIKGHGLYKKGKTVKKGGVSTVTATLKKGTYEFLCTVDAHAQAGMKGTLTVK